MLIEILALTTNKVKTLVAIKKITEWQLASVV